MPSAAETVEKLNTLGESDYIMIVNLINQLSLKNNNTDDLALFRKIRKETSKTPMTDDEIRAEVDAGRRELYGHSD